VLLGVWFGALMKPKPKPVEKPVRDEPAAENISDVAGCGMT
jgi:hypothetical protein